MGCIVDFDHFDNGNECVQEVQLAFGCKSDSILSKTLSLQNVGQQILIAVFNELEMVQVVCDEKQGGLLIFLF